MKAQNLDFDLVRTIQVIKTDGMLTSMFTKKFPDNPIDMVLEDVKNGSINDDVNTYAKDIFNSIINSAGSKLAELYSRNLTAATTKEEPKVEIKATKKSKTDKLPKEYNKIRIEADIKANNGVATEFHKAMLALNDMKNIRGRLNNKGKRQRYADGKPFTDSECREIIAVVAIIKNRLNKIK